MMFTIKNVGGKIKIFASVVLILDWIAAVICLLSMSYDIFVAFCVAIVVALSGVITCVPLYAFGQLVEDVQTLREIAEKKSMDEGKTWWNDITGNNGQLPEL